MWLEIRPAVPTIRREINSSASYINNKGEHPKIGNSILPEKIVFSDIKETNLDNGYWKFVNADQEIMDDISYLEIYDDMVFILRE